MTTFSLTGPLLGDSVTVTWTDGQLDGDFDAVGLARAYESEGVEVSAPGIWAGKADLSKAHSAYTTLLDILGGKPTAVTGDDPWFGFDPLPEGAVA